MTEPLKLWSVTSLIKAGLGTSEQLVNWNVRDTARRAVEGHDVIGAMLAKDDLEGAIDHLVSGRWRKSKKAMARGSEIHAAAEQLALGAEPDVEEHVRPYVDQYARWLEAFQPRFLMAEAPVYNVTYGYAGTCDGVLELAGRPLLFDIKTTEHLPGSDRMRPPYPEVALQLVAYSRAEHIGLLSEQRYSGGRRYYLFDPAAEHEPMPRVDGALAIVISPGDCLAVPVRVDEEIWEAFLDVQAAARWQIHTSRNLFGPPLAVPARQEVA
jgi:hypothetical protein